MKDGEAPDETHESVSRFVALLKRPHFPPAKVTDQTALRIVQIAVARHNPEERRIKLERNESVLCSCCTLKCSSKLLGSWIKCLCEATDGICSRKYTVRETCPHGIWCRDVNEGHPRFLVDVSHESSSTAATKRLVLPKPIP